MSKTDQFAAQAVGKLFLIQRKSSLSIEDYWKAVLVIAQNDAVLRAALQIGTYTVEMARPEEAAKPIVTDTEELVFQKPK